MKREESEARHVLLTYPDDTTMPEIDDSVRNEQQRMLNEGWITRETRFVRGPLIGQVSVAMVFERMAAAADEEDDADE